MLTPRQNVMEVMKGGNPDRFVKQFEFFEFAGDPLSAFGAFPEPGSTSTDAWGVTTIWPEGVITPFPMHDDEHKVVKDIKNWREYVHAPSLETTDEAWAEAIEIEKTWDRESKWYATGIFPGLFEQMHYLMSMNDALVNFYEAPDEMHELIDYYLDYLCRRADIIYKYIRPDMLMYSDDMGSHRSSFIS
ncbi:MAG: uroporphyrinogen decarboxylase, partial [Coriobacteriia bacterium]|nr:uroporphyrinogen decarboxylase [Coriobacteriia bacterium]